MAILDVVNADACPKPLDAGCDVEEQGEEEAEEEEEEEFEIEAVIGKREKKGKVFYSVRWKGCAEITEEPSENLTSCQELVDEFEKQLQDEAAARAIAYGLRKR